MDRRLTREERAFRTAMRPYAPHTTPDSHEDLIKSALKETALRRRVPPARLRPGRHPGPPRSGTAVAAGAGGGGVEPGQAVRSVVALHWRRRRVGAHTTRRAVGSARMLDRERGRSHPHRRLEVPGAQALAERAEARTSSREGFQGPVRRPWRSAAVVAALRGRERVVPLPRPGAVAVRVMQAAAAHCSVHQAWAATQQRGGAGRAEDKLDARRSLKLWHHAIKNGWLPPAS